METMPYHCSPLLPFPTQHDESSYLLWSPHGVLHENASVYAVDPCPGQQQQEENHEPLDMMLQDADIDAFAHCDEMLLGQENGSLVAIQEELMEENSLSDLLLAGAEAVEAGDVCLATAMVSRLDNLLLGVHDNAAVGSFDRLAYYFARGLQSRISGARNECHPTAAPQPPPPDTMSAHQMVQELSPFVKFAHFTANQAILEVTEHDTSVHVIDLDVGDGVQWPSLMSDLARRGNNTSFHLTAITTANTETPPTAGRWLAEFAESLSLPFQYNSLCIQDQNDLTEFSKNCRSSVIISCNTINTSYKSLNKLQLLLLAIAKKLHPKLVILAEEEVIRIGKEASFVEFLCEALHHFTAVFESLESCFCSSHGACLRIVEREMVGPRIQDSVSQCGSLTGGAGDLEGFRACELSSGNVAQAKMLVGLFSRGFAVVHHENRRLSLCWKSRDLIYVSAWTPE